MQLKTIEHEGVHYAVLNDGKPVYVHDDGKELPFDAPAAVAKISQLNGEAKSHREAKEAALERLKVFDGIGDPAEACKAIETVKNLDAKKLIDAGEAEKIKAEAERVYQERLQHELKQYEPIIGERDALKARLVREKIGGAFSRSKFIAEKLAIPADMVEARFGDRFKVEDEAIVGYDANGNKLYSRVKPGDIAVFDEALELLVEAYPHRDHILKCVGANGSGGAGGHGRGDNKTRTRAEFEEMGPMKQMEFIKGGGKVVD